MDRMEEDNPRLSEEILTKKRTCSFDNVSGLTVSLLGNVVVTFNIANITFGWLILFYTWIIKVLHKICPSTCRTFLYFKQYPISPDSDPMGSKIK